MFQLSGGVISTSLVMHICARLNLDGNEKKVILGLCIISMTHLSVIDVSKLLCHLQCKPGWQLPGLKSEANAESAEVL